MIRFLCLAAAVIALAGCRDPSAIKENPPVMPNIKGCTADRHVVNLGNGRGVEILYVVRCDKSKTQTSSATYSCGKNCTKTVVTTVVEGVSEEQKEKE